MAAKPPTSYVIHLHFISLSETESRSPDHHPGLQEGHEILWRGIDGSHAKETSQLLQIQSVKKNKGNMISNMIRNM